MMHNPPHPGLTLRDDVLPALEMGVTEAAEHLRVSRQALSNVLNGHAAISPEMALRLEAWLGPDNGGRADLWLAQQDAFDLWQTRSEKRRLLAAIEPIENFALALLTVTKPTQTAKRRAAKTAFGKRRKQIA